MDVEGFQWDDGNREKCARHGVTSGEVEALFRGEPRVAPVPAHSSVEDRFIAVGRTAADRQIFVVFIFRDVGDARLIRPISARYMHAKEAKAYAALGSQTDQ